jgi:hypothetical protein
MIKYFFYLKHIYKILITDLLWAHLSDIENINFDLVRKK